MRNRGYVYTLLTVIMVMLILSLVIFYFRITKPRIQDTITNIRTDELYYLINAIKEDYRRSSYISAQRAVLYAQNEVVENQTGLSSYSFNACPLHQSYPTTGSQSAIAELMLCGTFNGVESQVMTNHTIDMWLNRSTERARDINFNMSLTLTDFKIRPFGSYNILVLTNVSVSTFDRFGNPVHNGTFMADAVVPIDDLADPLYYLKTGDQDLLRQFSACNHTPLQANVNTIRDWVESGCYLPSPPSYGGPSFFDRLDGSLSQNIVYVQQANEVSALLNDSRLVTIGLESLVNLNDWQYHHNVTTNRSASWVDYLQWRNERGDCPIDLGEVNYSGFRLDSGHEVKYYVDGGTCEIYVNKEGSGDEFSKNYLSVPLNTMVVWTNLDRVENHTLLSGALHWPLSGREVKGYGTHIEQSLSGFDYGNYGYSCSESGHGGVGDIYITPPVMPTTYASVCSKIYYCGINTDGVCIRDVGVSCENDYDDDCSGLSYAPPFYADGGIMPKHSFSGYVRFSSSGLPVQQGTPIRVVAASTGDSWTTSVGGGGYYSIDVTFDDSSTGFDEGTSNGASLGFYVSGHPAATSVASFGSSTVLNINLPDTACVPGKYCSTSGCSGSWVKFERNGGGHDSCSSPYSGCVRSSGVGYYDQACCSGVVTQI